MQVIDFHTHTFEDSIAQRAIDKLRRGANIRNYLDGTNQALEASNKQEGVDLSVVLPVATKIMQADHINAINYKRNVRMQESGLLYFAAIHPEDSNIRAKLSGIKAAGFKGIKLHPVFQDAYIDEKCYLELIDAASDLDLITVIHAGEDVSFPGGEWASVPYLVNMIDMVHPRNLVLAHMGGWNEWDRVESDLAGADIYLDTSFCLNELEAFYEDKPASQVRLSEEQFCRIVHQHGADRVLFGSDSPWSSRSISIRKVKETGLEEEELECIFHKNAERLLKL